MFSTLATLLGVTLIVPALREVFHQLFHPSGAGSISGALMKAVWRMFYPVLRRRRSLNREVTLLCDTEPEGGDALGEMSADAAERMLKDLTSQLINVQSDIVQFPVTYYFHNTKEKVSLPLAMPYLARLAKQASSAHRPPEVRGRAAMLSEAIGDFSESVGVGFLGMPQASTKRSCALMPTITFGVRQQERTAAEDNEGDLMGEAEAKGRLRIR